MYYQAAADVVACVGGVRLWRHGKGFMCRHGSGMVCSKLTPSVLPPKSLVNLLKESWYCCRASSYPMCVWTVRCNGSGRTGRVCQGPIHTGLSESGKNNNHGYPVYEP